MQGGTRIPQTPYQRGRALEYSIRQKLRDLGYFVIRSASSKSPVDLVAIREDHTLLVQCKRDLRLPPAEWNEIWEIADRTGSLAIVAGVPNRRTEYRLIVGPKTKRGKQPWEPWAPPPSYKQAITIVA